MNRKFYFWAFLAILFLASFLIPVFLTLNFSQVARDAAHDNNEDRDGLFPSAFQVTWPGDFIRVKSSEYLLPSIGEDFIFFVWVKFKKVPEEAERIVFAVKFNPDEISQQGFTLGIARDGDAIFPRVGWRDQEGAGDAYRFSKMLFVPRRWILLALSFVEDRYLAVHAFVKSSTGDSKLHLLGGYELDPAVLPLSKQDLILGALNNGRFRGKIGPFGIISGEGYSADLETILRELSSSPLKVPELVKEEDVRLWCTDGKKDLSSYKHPVDNTERSSGPNNKGNRKRREKSGAV